MVNMDHGILPACTEEVRRDIQLPNTQIGIMGSIVYLGLVAGKALLLTLLNIFIFIRFTLCDTGFELLQY